MTISYKDWVHQEAARLGVSASAIYVRVSRGKYPWLPRKHVNERVVLVEMDKMNDWAGVGFHNDWL